MSFTKPTASGRDYPTQVGRLVDIVEGPALRNFIRNGDFQIAQRGTSFAGIVAEAYTLDGWRAGAAGTSTVTQESFTVGQTDVPDNPRKFLRLVRSVAAVADNELVSHRIEHPERLSGKAVTISFWARVASGTKALVFDFGSSGVTSAVNTADNAFTPTTAWALVSANVTLPAMTAATADAYLAFRIREAASFGTFTLDIADVQIEEGSEATRFERLNYDQQLAWCHRFLPGFTSTSTQSPIPGAGAGFSTTVAPIHMPFRVRARAAVTGASLSAGTHVTVTDQVTATAATSCAFNYGSAEGAVLNVTVASGLTQYRPYSAYFNSASGYIVFTGAEL